MRKPFTTIAVMLVRSIAPSASKRVSSYFIVLATFSISAIFHIVAFGCVSLCSAQAQLSFYIGIGIALLVEDVTINIAWPLLPNLLVNNRKDSWDDAKPGTSSGSRNDESTTTNTVRPPLGFRLLGYAWVFFFTVWSQSRFLFQDSRCTMVN